MFAIAGVSGASMMQIGAVRQRTATKLLMAEALSTVCLEVCTNDVVGFGQLLYSSLAFTPCSHQSERLAEPIQINPFCRPSSGVHVAPQLGNRESPGLQNSLSMRAPNMIGREVERAFVATAVQRDNISCHSLICALFSPI